MLENFTYLAKDINLQIQQAEEPHKKDKHNLIHTKAISNYISEN